MLLLLLLLLQRVGELERRRASMVQQTLGTFLHVYRTADCGIQQIAGTLQDLLQQIDAEADLEAFTETAASSVHRWGMGAAPLPERAVAAGCACRLHSVACRTLTRSILSCFFLSVMCCSAEALSVRQQEAVDQICSELLGSAEIVR